MKPAVIAVSGALFILAAAGIAAAQPLPVGKSNWENGHKSKLALDVDPSGRITGTFTTAVGCGAGKSRSVTGTFNGTAVSFTVNFQECNSITAWNGHHQKKGSTEELSTLWYLTIANDPPRFDSTLVGSDLFIRRP